MNRERIERFVNRYLAATGCRVVEKGDGHLTVRLSPEADKDLMNRSYYWSFVERTGAEPEPMAFKFIFDPEAGSGLPEKPVQAGVPIVPGGTAPGPAASGIMPGGQPGPPVSPDGQAPPQNSILGRYFGFVPAGGGGRVPSDVMTFGSRRLEQLFGVVQNKGRFVRLFEEMGKDSRNPFASVGYSTWLSVNFKVELVCDMKRDELHSLGIHLGTGQIVERFFERLRRRSLTPQLPSNIHLQPVRMSLIDAVEQLESFLEDSVKQYDHRWADDALRRLSDEYAKIDGYFQDLLLHIEPGKRAEVEEQYRNREQEIEWQYRPRIKVSVINCGFFHLAEGLRSPIDAPR